MTSTKPALTYLKTDTKGRVRTPAADREALLELFRQGSLSGAAFARMHGLRYSTFMCWIKKSRAAARTPAPSPFREVVLAPTPPRTEGMLVELPLGVRVRLERADQIPVIAALSRQLHEASGC